MSVLCNGYESLREFGLGAGRRQRLHGCMCVERHAATVSQTRWLASCANHPSRKIARRSRHVSACAACATQARTRCSTSPRVTVPARHRSRSPRSRLRKRRTLSSGSRRRPAGPQLEAEKRPRRRRGRHVRLRRMQRQSPPCQDLSARSRQTASRRIAPPMGIVYADLRALRRDVNKRFDEGRHGPNRSGLPGVRWGRRIEVLVHNPPRLPAVGLALLIVVVQSQTWRVPHCVQSSSTTSSIKLSWPRSTRTVTL